MNIHNYVITEYGEQTGREINAYQELQFKKIVSAIKGKSTNQINTLKNTILPRIALYKALLEMNYSKEEAFSKIKKYLDEYVGKDMNNGLKKLEIIPGFFSIFRNKMCKEVSTNDNWQVEVLENNAKRIRYNIKKCLWYEACKENDCLEICQIFCDADQVIYWKMKKVEFTRNGTIGKGSEYCDFCFSRK